MPLAAEISDTGVSGSVGVLFCLHTCQPLSVKVQWHHICRATAGHKDTGKCHMTHLYAVLKDAWWERTDSLVLFHFINRTSVTTVWLLCVWCRCKLGGGCHTCFMPPTAYLILFWSTNYFFAAILLHSLYTPQINFQVNSSQGFRYHHEASLTSFLVLGSEPSSPCHL